MDECRVAVGKIVEAMWISAEDLVVGDFDISSPGYAMVDDHVVADSRVLAEIVRTLAAVGIGSEKIAAVIDEWAAETDPDESARYRPAYALQWAGAIEQEAP